MDGKGICVNLLLGQSACMAAVLSPGTLVVKKEVRREKLPQSSIFTRNAGGEEGSEKGRATTKQHLYVCQAKQPVIHIFVQRAIASDLGWLLSQ